MNDLKYLEILSPNSESPRVKETDIPDPKPLTEVTSWAPLTNKQLTSSYKSLHVHLWDRKSVFAHLSLFVSVLPARRNDNDKMTAIAL